MALKQHPMEKEKWKGKYICEQNKDKHTLLRTHTKSPPWVLLDHLLTGVKNT